MILIYIRDEWKPDFSVYSQLKIRSLSLYVTLSEDLTCITDSLHVAMKYTFMYVDTDSQ